MDFFLLFIYMIISCECSEQKEKECCMKIELLGGKNPTKNGDRFQEVLLLLYVHFYIAGKHIRMDKTCLTYIIMCYITVKIERVGLAQTQFLVFLLPFCSSVFNLSIFDLFLFTSVYLSTCVSLSMSL